MLKEVFLFARPEEKSAIERALTNVVGPGYTAMSALGRGSKGGIESGVGNRSLIARLFARPALSSFLPKVAYYFVLEDEDIEYVLRAVHGTLALEGGPDDCGKGLAIVSAVDAQYGIELELSPRAEKIEEEGTPHSSEKVVSL